MTLFNPWHSPPPTQGATLQSCKKKDKTFQVYGCLSGVRTESLDFHCFGPLLARENELRGNKGEKKYDMQETFSLGFLASLHQSIIMTVTIMIVIFLVIIVFSSSCSSR